MTAVEKERLAAPAPHPHLAPLAPRTWRLPAIDGLRAMACMMVYTIHTWEFASTPAVPINFHWFSFDFARLVETFPAGVDLFMVLSGFCLFWPLCKSEEALKKWSWQEYVVRRVKRICPPYYIAIAYVIILPQVMVFFLRLAHVQIEGHDAHYQPNPSFFNILTHGLFIHTLSFHYWDGITGAFWSLGLEMQFYFVFPLVVYRYRKNRVWAIVGMIAASVAFRIIISCVFYFHYGMRDGELMDVNRLCGISFLGRWMQFASGMLAALAVAHYYRNHRVISAGMATALVALAAFSYFVVLQYMTPLDQAPLAVQIIPVRDTLMGALFSVLVFAVTSSKTWLRYIFEIKPVVFLGTISYSVFLIHQTTGWFFSEFVRKVVYMRIMHKPYDFPPGGSVGHWVLMNTAGLAVVLLVAYPYYLCFEKPFIANHNKKKPAPQSNSAPLSQPIVPAPTPAT